MLRQTAQKAWAHRFPVALFFFPFCILKLRLYIQTFRSTVSERWREAQCCEICNTSLSLQTFIPVHAFQALFASLENISLPVLWILPDTSEMFSELWIWIWSKGATRTWPYRLKNRMLSLDLLPAEEVVHLQTSLIRVYNAVWQHCRAALGMIPFWINSGLWRKVLIDQGKNFISARPNHIYAEVLDEVTILEEGVKSAHVVLFF